MTLPPMARHHRYHGLLQLENAMNFIWLGNRTQQKLPREVAAEPYRNLPLLSALDDQVQERPAASLFQKRGRCTEPNLLKM